MNWKCHFNKSGHTYDEEADVSYINFKKLSRTNASELTNNDIMIRYEKC